MYGTGDQRMGGGCTHVHVEVLEDLDVNTHTHTHTYSECKLPASGVRITSVGLLASAAVRIINTARG